MLIYIIFNFFSSVCLPWPYLLPSVCFLACFQHLISSSGSIKSPNFPKYYPHNAECYYLITQRDRLKIVLDFKQFSLESDSSCRHDSVKIYDGSSVTAPQLGEVHGYCGRHLPPSLTSTGDSLLIIFTSDRSDRYYTGFHITYRAIGKPVFKVSRLSILFGQCQK